MSCILLIIIPSISVGQHIVFESKGLVPFKNDSISFNPGKLSDSMSFIGKESVRMSKKSPFGLTVELKNLQAGDVYEFSVYRHQSNKNINLIVTGSWNKYYVAVKTISDHENGWDKLSWRVKIPETDEAISMSVYTFNYYGKSGFVDNLKIIKKPRTDSILPLYTVAQIFYDVTNHHAIKNQDNLCLKQIKKLDPNFFPIDLFEYYTSSFKEFQFSIEYYLKKFGDKELKKLIYQTRKDLTSPNSKSPFETQMKVQNCAAYLNKVVHFEHDKLELNFQEKPHGFKAEIHSLEHKYELKFLESITLRDELSQSININHLKEGFYKIVIQSAECSFTIPFIKQIEEKEEICIIIPTTTWHAYNMYGGKSLYRNNIDLNTVNFVSTKRPITSIDLDSVHGGHDFYILKNLYDWYNTNYGASIYPDYWLEKYPKKFKKFKTLVLAQHCEYFSLEMYANLKSLVETRNLMSLGGNQVYWKIKWNSNYDEIECRKDWSFFENTLEPGMHWRDRWFGEAALLGVGYTHSGIGTYSSFTMLNKQHWLFNGCDTTISNFGEQGYDSRGLSGDETDEIMEYSPKNLEQIAIGNNEGNGGGSMIFIDRGEVATYSCGAISCASGVGIDKTFTKVVINFLERFHKN